MIKQLFMILKHVFLLFIQIINLFLIFKIFQLKQFVKNTISLNKTKIFIFNYFLLTTWKKCFIALPVIKELKKIANTKGLPFIVVGSNIYVLNWLMNNKLADGYIYTHDILNPNISLIDLNSAYIKIFYKNTNDERKISSSREFIQYFMNNYVCEELVWINLPIVSSILFLLVRLGQKKQFIMYQSKFLFDNALSIIVFYINKLLLFVSVPKIYFYSNSEFKMFESLMNKYISDWNYKINDNSNLFTRGLIPITLQKFIKEHKKKVFIVAVETDSNYKLINPDILGRALTQISKKNNLYPIFIYRKGDEDFYVRQILKSYNFSNFRLLRTGLAWEDIYSIASEVKFSICFESNFTQFFAQCGFNSLCISGLFNSNIIIPYKKEYLSKKQHCEWIYFKDSKPTLFTGFSFKKNLYLLNTIKSEDIVKKTYKIIKSNSNLFYN